MAATERAVKRTEERIGSNALLSIVPQLVQIDADLSAALAGDRTEQAAQMLTRWRNLAAQLRGLASRVAPDAEALLAYLVDATALAAIAEQALTEGRPGTTASVRRARAAVANATGEAAFFTAGLQLYTGEDDRA